MPTTHVTISTSSRLLRMAALALALSAMPAEAQQQPVAPVQGSEPIAPPVPLLNAPQGPLIDYREELRKFIEGIANYARSQNRRFYVVARDPGELIIKRDVQDENIISPARTFMRSIDGVMFDGVFYGQGTVGQPPRDDIRVVTMDRIERAKRNGLPVLVMDFAIQRNKIDEVFAKAGALGAAAFVGHRPSPELTEIPPYPPRPNMENPNNILSLDDVKNFVYLADPAAYGRQDQFALKMHDTNYDLIIVDPFSGRDPLSKQAVETLKYKKIGAKRLVFARMDITSAASYRYYWQPGWGEGYPGFIGAPYPGDPDRYFVDYWNPAWQQLMSGDTNSYIYGILAQGYDGVVLEGLTTYLAFEGNVEIPQAFAPLQMPQN